MAGPVFPPYPQQPQPEPEPEFIEADPVSVFRQHEYERAGCSSENAWLLATRSEVDWHHVVKLLRQGVDEMLVVRMFV